MGLVRLQTI